MPRRSEDETRNSNELGTIRRDCNILRITLLHFLDTGWREPVDVVDIGNGRVVRRVVTIHHRQITQRLFMEVCEGTLNAAAGRSVSNCARLTLAGVFKGRLLSACDVKNAKADVLRASSRAAKRKGRDEPALRVGDVSEADAEFLQTADQLWELIHQRAILQERGRSLKTIADWGSRAHYNP